MVAQSRNLKLETWKITLLRKLFGGKITDLSWEKERTTRFTKYTAKRELPTSSGLEGDPSDVLPGKYPRKREKRADPE